MNRKLIKALILLPYCIPYGYLSMRGDLYYGTMLFYGLMAVSLTVLLVVALRTKNIIVLILGNILCFISSYIFILGNQREDWTAYFKPFTPLGLLLLIAIVAIVIQVLFIFLFKKIQSKQD